MAFMPASVVSMPELWEIRAADAPLDGFSGERGEFRKSEGLRGAGSKE